MTVFVPGTTAADLSSYGGLISTIETWLEDSSADISGNAPYFIQLAEARFRRLIVNPESEAKITLTAAGTVPLPDDYDSARAISLAGDGTMTVSRVGSQVSPSVFSENAVASATIGQTPTIFRIIGGNMEFSPAPTSDIPAVLIYRRTIPTLSDSNPSNWLLAAHPDLYLYGALIHAEAFGWNDSRLPVLKDAVDEMIQEVRMAGNRKRYGGGPLYMRPSVSDGRYGVYR